MDEGQLVCYPRSSLCSWRSCEKAENPMRRIRFLAPMLNKLNFSPPFEFVQHGARNRIRLIGFSAFSQDRQRRRLSEEWHLLVWGQCLLRSIKLFSLLNIIFKSPSHYYFGCFPLTNTDQIHMWNKSDIVFIIVYQLEVFWSYHLFI